MCCVELFGFFYKWKKRFVERHFYIPLKYLKKTIAVLIREALKTTTGKRQMLASLRSNDSMPAAHSDPLMNPDRHFGETVFTAKLGGFNGEVHSQLKSLPCFSDHKKLIAQPVEMLLLKDQYILVLHVYIVCCLAVDTVLRVRGSTSFKSLCTPVGVCDDFVNRCLTERSSWSILYHASIIFVYFSPASVMCAVCSSCNDVWKKMSNGIFQRGPVICTEHIDAMVMLWLKDANTVNVNPLMSECNNLQNSFQSIHLQPRQEIRTGSWDLQTWFIH